MRQLNIDKQAVQFTITLQPKQFKQIHKAILELLDNPRPNDSKQLIGYENIFRKDVGEYRIVYRFNEQIVFIMLIDKRNDSKVYKAMKRLYD